MATPGLTFPPDGKLAGVLALLVAGALMTLFAALPARPGAVAAAEGDPEAEPGAARAVKSSATNVSRRRGDLLIAGRGCISALPGSS